MILIPLVIIAISLLTLFPVFHVGLHGDDWLVIFRYVVHLGPSSEEGLNYISYFLTPYGAQDIILGLIYQNFGTQGVYYEITAYIFRMIAAFSLYPVVFYLTKSKLATFFAILFFGVTTTGFNSTGWLSDLPTYLAIAFFNIFLYFYIIFKEAKKIKFLILSVIFLYLAYVTVSARMLGAPLFILSLEVFWLLRDRTINNLKYSILRISFVFAILITVATLGRSLGNSGDWFARLASSLTTIQKLLAEGRSDFLFYPIVTIGGMIIPNFIFHSIQITSVNDMLSSVALPSLVLFLFFLCILQANTFALKMRDVYITFLVAVGWILSVFILHNLNISTFSSSTVILMLAIGGLTIILWILLALKYYTQKNILTALFISFSWTLFSFFFAWLWNPSSYIDSTHRYLMASSVGISILLAIIISLGKKLKNQFYLAILLSLLLIVHMRSTRVFINELLFSHSQQTTDKIWSAIPAVPQIGKEPLVFYFEGDDSNGTILGESVMFGFSFRMALLYNMTDTGKMPIPTQDWKEVVSTVKDGKLLKGSSYPFEPLPIDHIYAFHLQGRDNLINITDVARQKLTEEK